MASSTANMSGDGGGSVLLGTTTPDAYLDKKRVPRVALTRGLHLFSDNELGVKTGSGIRLDPDTNTLTAASSEVKLLRGLRSYYTCDALVSSNVLPDFIGPHVGIASSDVTIATGKIESALSFPGGTSESVDLNAQVPGALSHNEADFTWACWVKLTDTSANQELITAEGSNGDAIILRYNTDDVDGTTGADPGLYVVHISGGGAETDTVGPVSDGTGKFTFGTWVHIVLRRKGTELALYVNDESVTAVTSPPAAQTTTVTATTTDVGGESGVAGLGDLGTASGFVSGLIDEVGIWERALTLVEINKLHNLGDATNEFLDYDREWYRRPARSDVQMNQNRIVDMADSGVISEVDLANVSADTLRRGATIGTLDDQTRQMGLLRMIRAYYDFEGTTSNFLQDRFRTFNGTAQGTASQNGVPKLGSNSLALEPSSDYVALGNALHVKANDFTIATWAKTMNGATKQILWSTFDDVESSASTGMQLVYEGALDTPEVKLTYIDSAGSQSITEAFTLSTSPWYYFVAQRNGTNIKFLVFDESASAVADAAGTVNTASDVLTAVDNSVIGSKHETAETWDGLVDGFGVWERSLTDTEITSLVNYGAGTERFLSFEQSSANRAFSRHGVLYVAAATAPDYVKQQAHYVCSGANDETEINAALARASANNEAVQLSAGTFSVEFGIDFIAAGQTLYGAGNEATIIQATTVNTRVMTIGVDGTTLRDLTLDGNRDGLANTTYTTDSETLFVDNAANCSIIRVRALNSNAEAVSGNNCGITMDDCFANQALGSGFVFTGTSDVLLSNCQSDTNAIASRPQDAGFHIQGDVKAQLTNCFEVSSARCYVLEPTNIITMSNCVGIQIFDSSPVITSGTVDAWTSTAILTGCAFLQRSTTGGPVAQLDSANVNSASLKMSNCTFVSDVTGSGIALGLHNFRNAEITGCRFDNADTNGECVAVNGGANSQYIFTGIRVLSGDFVNDMEQNANETVLLTSSIYHNLVDNATASPVLLGSNKNLGL